MLTVEDKKFITNSIADALQTVMVPALDNMREFLEQKIETLRSDWNMRFDRLDRKFDAQQERSDRHGDRIEKLENLHPGGKHNYVSS